MKKKKIKKGGKKACNTIRSIRKSSISQINMTLEDLLKIYQIKQLLKNRTHGSPKRIYKYICTYIPYVYNINTWGKKQGKKRI
jgi:hypothetical protein